MRCAAWLAVAVVAVGCGGGGGFPADAPPEGPPPGGRVAVAWTLTDSGGQPITCEDVGAQLVTLVLRNQNVLGDSSEVFACGSASGETLLLAPGTYEVQFELRGASGSLATAPKQVDVVVRSSQTTQLEPVTFAVEATGAVELSVVTGKSGGNCGLIADMGAGITGTTIILQRGDGSCEPVTFTISAGATMPAGTYTVNCAAAVVGPCIEADQKLTVASMPSGTYQIHVAAQVDSLDCYRNDDMLVVPPLSNTLVRALTLAVQTTPGC